MFLAFWGWVSSCIHHRFAISLETLIVPTRAVRPRGRSPTIPGWLTLARLGGFGGPTIFKADPIELSTVHRECVHLKRIQK